ncbi:MAG: YceI family protein [Solirubrobacterales bacterium]
MTTQTIKQEIPVGTYVVDPIHSSVTFAVTHNGVSTFRSGFADYEVRLLGGEAPRLEGSVDVASIEIYEEQLKGHLLSPEFFDAERHPRLHFESTELHIADDGSVRLRGELEIRGKKHGVEASGRIAQLGADLSGKARVGLSLEATVDRRDFGLDWSAELPSGDRVLEYEVSIAIDLELVEEAE